MNILPFAYENRSKSPVSFCPDFEADDDNYQNTFIIGVGRGAPGGSSPHPQ